MVKVKKVLETRGTKRDIKGKKVWKILWENKEVTWEPLCHLVDTNTYLEDMEDILKEYKAIAEKSPYAKRYCLNCEKSARIGGLFCKKKKCKFLKKRVKDITST